MNTFTVVLLLIGGVIVFFIPMIMEKTTGQTKKISGRKVFLYKEPNFIDTEEGRTVKMAVGLNQRTGRWWVSTLFFLKVNEYGLKCLNLGDKMRQEIENMEQMQSLFTII